MTRTRQTANNIDQAIGQRLRIVRRAFGLSQSRLAEKIGLSFQQVQKYEIGTNRISCSTLVSICNALGMSISYFFADERISVYRDAPGGNPFPNREVTRVLMAVAAMPTERKKLLRAISEQPQRKPARPAFANPAGRSASNGEPRPKARHS